MQEGSGSSRPTEVASSLGAARFLLPSVADGVFVAMLAVLTLTPLSVRLLGDAGIGWHIRTGQQIIETRAIPRVDSFSSTMSGKPWFAWEWLYDLGVGEVEHTAGLNGVVFLTALIGAAVFAWTFHLLVARGTNLLLATVLVVLSASASMIHLLARPHVVSWLFTLAWFWILDSSERECFARPTNSGYKDTGSRLGDKSRNRGQHVLWLLPLLMLVWVNVHGGFLIGFVLLAIYWFGAAWRWYKSGDSLFEEFIGKLRAKRRVKRLTMIGVLTVLTTFVNPYGWNLDAHIYHYLSDRFLMDHIDEFQSPNFHGVAERCFALLIVLALVALAARSRDLRLSQALVVLFAIYSGLYASRNLPVASLFLVLVAGPLLTKSIASLAGRHAPMSGPDKKPLTSNPSFWERMQQMESRLAGHVWPIVAVIVGCVAVTHGGSLGAKLAMNAHFDEARFPVAAVDYIERNRIPGPVLNPDSWGGYLIYKLYPQVKVVVDDRHDLYGSEFFEKYLKMIRVEPGWQDFLLDHDSGCIVVPKQSALANILLQTGRWKPLYSDGVAIVFAKK